LGNNDGPGGGSTPHAQGRGGAESHPTGYGGGGGGSGSTERLRPRKVVGLYRDRPALIRSYNVVACITNQFSRVLLTPGGMNVSGSKAIARSHLFPATGSIEGVPAREAGGRGGILGIVSINGWEFGEDPWEQLYSMAQAAPRNSFGASGSISAGRGIWTSSRFGSPRVTESRRSGAFDAVATRIDPTGRGDG
ncbi:unnamed protein product, partial [Hapterophycus canaliculatus]